MKGLSNFGSGGLALLLLASAALASTACSAGADAPANRPEPSSTKGAGLPNLLDAPEPTVCPLAPKLARSQSARLAFPVHIEFGGAPLEIGTMVSDSQGTSYDVTFFSFFVGNFQLVDTTGTAQPAALLTDDGQARIYDLQLINLDDPTTQQVQLAAAPGRYQALRFSVGVSQACDRLTLPERVWPLTVESEMGWGWTMLHLRVEGFVSAQGHRFNFMHHLGFPQHFRTLQVPASIDLTTGSDARTLRLAVDQVLGAGAVLPESGQIPDDELADNLARDETFSLQ